MSPNRRRFGLGGCARQMLALHQLLDSPLEVEPELDVDLGAETSACSTAGGRRGGVRAIGLALGKE